MFALLAGMALVGSSLPTTTDRPPSGALASDRPSLGAPDKAPNTIQLQFGREPWHLAFSLGDLKPVEGFESSLDRKVYTYWDGRGTVLSVIVENAHQPASIESCRDVFERRKAALQPVNEVQGQRGDAATQEYDLKIEFQSKPISNRHIFACRVRGTYYIDVHASKIPYVPADHNDLVRLIDAVRLSDDQPLNGLQK